MVEVARARLMLVDQREVSREVTTYFTQYQTAHTTVD